MKRFGIIGTAVLFGVFAFTATARAQDHDKDAQDSHQQEDAKPEKQQPDHNKAAKPEHHDQEKQNDQKKEGQNKDQEKAAQQQDKDQQKAAKQQDNDQEKAAKQQEHDQQKAEHDQQKQEDKNRKDAEKADKHDQHDQNDDRRANDQHATDQHANDQRQVQQSPERRVSANDQKNVWQEHRAHSWQSEHRTWQQRGGYHGYRIPDDRFRASFGEAHEFVIVNQPVVVVEGFPRFQFAGFWFALVDPLPEYWAPTWYQTDECYVDYSDGGYYLTDVRYPQVRVAVNVFVQ